MKKNETQLPLQMEAIESDLHTIVNWFHLGIVLPLEAMDEWIKKEDYEKVKELLPRLVIQSRSILRKTRKIQSNIFKARNSKTGTFQDSLKRLSRLWENRSGLKKHIKIECPEKFVTSELVKQSLLSITDECFSNAIKHSGIMNDSKIGINVIVKNKKGFITLEIVDSGQGTDKIVQGYGFNKIKRAISQLNRAGIASSIEIVTSVTKGFKVKISVTA
jgi:signal transduction histidine kinase